MFFKKKGGIDKEEFKTKLENICNEIIAENLDTKTKLMEKSEMNSVCKIVPDYIPSDKPSRVVLFGDYGVPCGGTHINNLSEIKHLTVRKIKVKGGKVKISYEI